MIHFELCQAGWLGDGAAIVSAVAALLAVIAAWLANCGTKAMRRVQTFLALDARYNTPEMNESLRILREMWPRRSGPLNGSDWHNRIESPSTTDDIGKAQERYNAVRHVKSHYFNIAQIIRRGGPEGQAGRDAAFNYGLELFFQVVQPIEKARQTERWPFDDIYKIVTEEDGKTLKDRVNLNLEQLRKWDVDVTSPTNGGHAGAG